MWAREGLGAVDKAHTKLTKVPRTVDKPEGFRRFQIGRRGKSASFYENPKSGQRSASQGAK
jgi:hypothetical protein